MSSWYYVQGTERMGPVDQSELHNIFKSGNINRESYVWTKGFVNWERLSDVSELQYYFEEEKIESLSSHPPEAKFYFDWQSFSKTEEVFFILTGKDRNGENEEIIGPYSLNELQGAFEQKRINEKTYIYTPGMHQWERIGCIVTICNLWKISHQNTNEITKRIPNFVILDRKPIPVVSLIKNIKDSTITILCSQHVFEGEELNITLYKEEKLVGKNITLKVIGVNQFKQTVDCDFSELEEKNKKIIYDCAE